MKYTTGMLFYKFVFFNNLIFQGATHLRGTLHNHRSPTEDRKGKKYSLPALTLALTLAVWLDSLNPQDYTQSS